MTSTQYPLQDPQYPLQDPSLSSKSSKMSGYWTNLDRQYEEGKIAEIGYNMKPFPIWVTFPISPDKLS